MPRGKGFQTDSILYGKAPARANLPDIERPWVLLDMDSLRPRAQIFDDLKGQLNTSHWDATDTAKVFFTDLKDCFDIEGYDVAWAAEEREDGIDLTIFDRTYVRKVELFIPNTPLEQIRINEDCIRTRNHIEYEQLPYNWLEALSIVREEMDWFYKVSEEALPEEDQYLDS